LTEFQRVVSAALGSTAGIGTGAGGGGGGGGAATTGTGGLKKKSPVSEEDSQGVWLSFEARLTAIRTALNTSYTLRPG
jgi:hypothetical protein